MKKIILILFAVLSINTFAQKKVSFGLKGGLNIASLTNSNLDSKLNGYAGVFLNVAFSDLYEMQPEILYSNQGGKLDINNDQTVTIEYFSIGVANNFFVNRDGKLYLSIVPSIDLDVDDSFIGIVNDNEWEEGNDATFVDLALGIGLGYRVNNNLAIEARYKRGLIDVYSGSFHDFEVERYENETQFNSVFQIGISYRFKK
ncbi:porin family protein [Seonamhaeicola marinus]|uniref:PorT family protein n=1 Tax=Seonamhaeicola marinus TaxID=1912246 RepID=A0A5D0HWY6_9FLAO|nr:porin family protein [Seonamhaeicola marinus]TYA73962.1 PorT family protein [Seonamhaeicola marinus]